MFVFGNLFLSADPAFRSFFSDISAMNWQTFAGHVFTSGICAWVLTGYLLLLIAKKESSLLAYTPIGGASLPAVALAIPLGTLNALFLLFLCVQGRFMFAGEILIRTRTGLTYSEYARQGFFELLTVAALTLFVLWTADWFARKAAAQEWRALRILMISLVGLVYVVMVSALFRMHMYLEAYGLTEQRLYATVFMLWLAIVFAWFLATVLRGHHERFLFGALVSGAAFVFGLHVLNPDAFITRSNLARLETRVGFDASYAAALSADAIPVLVKAAPTLSPEAQTKIFNRVRAWAAKDTSASDWRTWSWGRHCARKNLPIAAIEQQPTPGAF